MMCKICQYKKNRGDEVIVGLLNAGPHVYSFTIGQLWQLILTICGGITAVSAAIAVIIKQVNKAREPNTRQDEKLALHDKRFEAIDDSFDAVNHKLSADKDRLDLFQSKLVSLEERQKENSITIEVHDRKIVEAEQRIGHSEQGNNVTMKALLALLSHGIDGNAIEPMKEAKADLENYLIDGQNIKKTN